MSEEIKSPREAAEYFCWIAGKDEQVESLAAAFEARDNHWRHEVTRLSAELEAAKRDGEICTAYALTGWRGRKAAERRCSEMERAVEVARDDAEAVLEYIADGHEASARAQIKRSVERLNAALAYTTQIAGEAKEPCAGCELPEFYSHGTDCKMPAPAPSAAEGHSDCTNDDCRQRGHKPAASGEAP